MRRRGVFPGAHVLDDRMIAALVLGDAHGALTPRFLAWVLGIPITRADAIAGDLVSRGYVQEVAVTPPRYRLFRATPPLRLLAQVRDIDAPSSWA